MIFSRDMARGHRTTSTRSNSILNSLSGLLFVWAVTVSAMADTMVDGDNLNATELAHQYVFENYDKSTHQVPMRDGTRLHTQIYTPKDKSKPYPILLVRTPYRVFFHQGGPEGYFGLLGPGPGFIEEGYIFVVQDVRGRFLSEGSFEVMRPNTANWADHSQYDESTDAWDTIDWLIENVKNHNGKVGTHGVSYPGTYAALSLVKAHPSLVATVIEAPVGDVYLGDDYYHNGAKQILYPFMWLNNIGLAERNGPSETIQPPICDSFEENYFASFLKMGPISNMNEICFKNRVRFWDDALKHETYDAFWQERSLGQYMKSIKKPAVLVVGSWFDDQDLFGTLHTYRAIEMQNPSADNMLVMGPWNHAKWWDQKKQPWGKAKIPVKETAAHYRQNILLPFFNHHLKDGQEPRLPEATVFETGSDNWREYQSWPPQEADPIRLYFGASGSLRNEKPTNRSNRSDRFVSDPSNPVPQIPADQMWGWTSEVMHYDQSFLAERDDVLKYTSHVLEEDTTLAGPIEANLYVSTTGTDADWIVKLIDVYPEDGGDQSGYQMLIRGEIMRGKFREGFENPKPFTPGQTTKVQINLPDINHTFRKGHRIMVQVQSSWFPMFDRNPQTFVNIPSASEEDFKPATHKVYRSKKYPSHITLRVVSTPDVPSQ